MTSTITATGLRKSFGGKSSLTVSNGHTSYGDITIRRSRLASGTGEEGQP